MTDDEAIQAIRDMQNCPTFFLSRRDIDSVTERMCLLATGVMDSKGRTVGGLQLNPLGIRRLILAMLEVSLHANITETTTVPWHQRSALQND